MASMLSQSNGNGTAPRILPASEMSASQRRRVLDATIQQLNLVITQVNALTGQVNVIEQRTATLLGDFWEADCRHKMFISRSFWQRLRWLVTGR